MRKLNPARLLFATAVAASLSAGAQSAFARPAAAAREEAVCYSGICYRECRDNGWAYGSCVNGYCECR
jgi:hypothetical protein